MQKQTQPDHAPEAAAPSEKPPRIEILSKGRVAPLTNMTVARGGKRGEFDGGAYYSDGSVCATGLQIKGSLDNRPRAIGESEIAERISGCHIFGGLLQNRHFGHFITESITRIWAAEYLSSDFRSIVFYLRSLDRPIAGFVGNVLNELSPGLEVRFVSAPTEFEILAVPEQIGHPKHGFVYGHSAVRRAFRKARANRSAGPKKVYVSRSALKAMEGGFLLEELLEQNLEREGYVIIHPQELSIKEQLDIYYSAENLVFAEGSALHLYALMARPEQRVFSVWRRKMSGGFDWQIRSFGGAPLCGTPSIRRMWVPGSEFGAAARARADLDFEDLRRQLMAGGFISGSNWKNPSDEEIADELGRLQKVTKTPFIECPAP